MTEKINRPQPAVTGEKNRAVSEYKAAHEDVVKQIAKLRAARLARDAAADEAKNASAAQPDEKAG